MSDGGKGSSPRPFSVDKQTFNDNYDQIFKKAKSCNKDCVSTKCALAQARPDSCCKTKGETSGMEKTSKDQTGQL